MKGKRAEVLTYFKKVDEFARAHPQANEEELNQFIRDNTPKWKPGEKRRIDTAFIADQAATEAARRVREDLEPRLNAAQKKIREQEIAPIIDKATGEFDKLMFSTDSVPENADMEPIPSEVNQRIKDAGFETALEEHPIEVPIVAHAQQAAREWMRLTNGITQFNGNDPIHAWLINFVARQGDIQASKPDAVQDGRRFMPLIQYLETCKNNPQAAQSYWSFDDKDVLNMIAVNANLAYNAKVKSLEKAGFKREKKKPLTNPPNPAPTPQPVQPPAAPPTSTSPRMRGTSSPGPAEAPKNNSPTSAFLDKLVPGTSQRIGAD